MLLVNLALTFALAFPIGVEVTLPVPNLQPPLVSSDGTESFWYRDALYRYRLPVDAPSAAIDAAMEWNEETGLPIFEAGTGFDDVEELPVEIVVFNDFGGIAPANVLAFTDVAPVGCLETFREDTVDSVMIWKHELGHCIGFDHARGSVNSLMNAFRWNDDVQRPLTPGILEIIQIMWSRP